MSNREKWITRLTWFFAAVMGLYASGIMPAIVPALVPTANKQGNSSKFALAGTNSGVSGAALCNDANGNTTTSSCAPGGNTNSFGAYASLPGSGTTSGDTYRSTNTAHTFIWNGSAWLPFWSSFPVVIPPATGAFTAVNATGTTFTSTLGALTFTCPASGTDNIRSQMVAMPMGSWSVTAQIHIGIPTVDFNNHAVSLRDSASGRIMLFGPGYNTAAQGPNITIAKYTNNTTFSSSIGTRSYNQFPRCYRITDDTTNFTWFLSWDCANYFQVAQEARTAFLAAPDQVGLSLNSISGSSGTLWYQVVSWDLQ